MPLITTFIRSASQKTRQQVRKLRYQKSDNVTPLLLSQSTSSVVADVDGDSTNNNGIEYDTSLFIFDVGDIDSSDHSSVDNNDAVTDDDVSILLLAPPSKRNLFDNSTYKNDETFDSRIEQTRGKRYYSEDEDNEVVDDGRDNGTEDDDKALFASMMESESSLSNFLRTKIVPATRRRRASITSSRSRSSSSKTSPISPISSSITEIEISEKTEDLSDSLSFGEDEIWWSLKDSDTITTARGSSVDTIKSSSKNNRKKNEEQKKKKKRSQRKKRELMKEKEINNNEKKHDVDEEEEIKVDDEIIKDNKAQEQSNEISLVKNREGRRSGKNDDLPFGNQRHDGLEIDTTRPLPMSKRSHSTAVVSSSSKKSGRRPRRTTSSLVLLNTKIVSSKQQQQQKPQPQRQLRKARSRSRSSKSTSHVTSVVSRDSTTLPTCTLLTMSSRRKSLSLNRSYHHPRKLTDDTTAIIVRRKLKSQPNINPRTTTTTSTNRSRKIRRLPKPVETITETYSNNKWTPVTSVSDDSHPPLCPLSSPDNDNDNADGVVDVDADEETKSKKKKTTKKIREKKESVSSSSHHNRRPRSSDNDGHRRI